MKLTRVIQQISKLVEFSKVHNQQINMNTRNEVDKSLSKYNKMMTVAAQPHAKNVHIYAKEKLLIQAKQVGREWVDSKKLQDMTLHMFNAIVI